MSYALSDIFGAFKILLYSFLVLLGYIWKRFYYPVQIINEIKDLRKGISKDYHSFSSIGGNMYEYYSYTFSISSSLCTKRLPVEEPANNLTPQHPSTPFKLARLD